MTASRITIVFNGCVRQRETGRFGLYPTSKRSNPRLYAGHLKRKRPKRSSRSKIEVGDRVNYPRHGIQEIRWVVHVINCPGHEAGACNAHLLPVLIASGGALGEQPMPRARHACFWGGGSAPTTAFLVAERQKRRSISKSRKSSCGRSTMTGPQRCLDIVETLGHTYIHMMFDHTKVSLSPTVTWTESFQPGDMSPCRLWASGSATKFLELSQELANATKRVGRHVAAAPNAHKATKQNFAGVKRRLNAATTRVPHKGVHGDETGRRLYPFCRPSFIVE